MDDEFIDVLVHDYDYVHEFCGASACTLGRKAIVPYAYYPHELIHAYASERGRSIRLLEEGLAIYAGECRGPWSASPFETSIDLRPLARSSTHADFVATSPEELYGASGSFVAYLVERFGWSTFMRLYETLDYDDGLDTIDDRSREVLGQSLDALVTDWERWPKPAHLELCAREAAPMAALPLGMDTATYCVEPIVGAAEPGSAEPGIVGALRVDARSRLEVRLDEEVGATSEVLTRSLPANRILRTPPTSGRTLHTFDLPIDDYALRFWLGPYVPESGEGFPTFVANLEPRDPNPCLETPIDVTDITTLAYGEMLSRTAGDSVHAVLTLEVTETRWVVDWELPGGAVSHFCVDECAAGSPCVLPNEVLPSITGTPIVLEAGKTYRIVLTRLQQDTILWANLRLAAPF